MFNFVRENKDSAIKEVRGPILYKSIGVLSLCSIIKYHSISATFWTK